MTFTGRGGKHSGPIPAQALPETDTQKIAHAQRDRSLFLVTEKGKADIQDALFRITQDDRKERLNGAVILKKLRSGKSFTPILEAVEKEQDKEVKLQLLKALCATSRARDVEKPLNMVERLENLILTEVAGTDSAETDMLIARQAAIALYLHGPHDRSDGLAYMIRIRDQAEEAHGKEHAISRGIAVAISHLLTSDEI